MKLYVQVLVLVLCSCFVQDALSLRGASGTEEPPSRTKRDNAAMSKREAAVTRKDSATMANKQEKPVSTRRASASAAVPKKETPTAAKNPPNAAAGAAKRRSSAPAKTRSAPPAKYPNLEKLKGAFWNKCEEINAESPNGKLLARSVRNLVGNVLANHLFWDTVAYAARKKAKEANDEVKANNRIKVCNFVTEKLTGQSLTAGFLTMIDDVYKTAAMVNVDPATNALKFTTDLVNDEVVDNLLDMAQDIVNSVNLNPQLAEYMFNSLKRIINISGTMKINDVMASKLSKVSKTFNSMTNKQNAAKDGSTGSRRVPARSNSQKTLSSRKSFDDESSDS